MTRIDPNLRRAAIPPATATAIRYIRDRCEQLIKLNGAATETTRGHIMGLRTVQALIVEAIGDEASSTGIRAPRAIIPPALVEAIRAGRDERERIGRIEHPADMDEGHAVGLTDALSLILEAAVDEASNPATPL